MAVRSIYCPDMDARILNGTLDVDGEEHRHLSVSRIRLNEHVEVFDGRGSVWEAVVIRTGRRVTRLRMGEVRRVPGRTTEIILAQALIRNAPFDLILEKAVELGVTRIVPFRAERSNETGRGRENRWQRIVIEATKQSKQYYVPHIDPVSDLAGVAGLEAASKVVFTEDGEGDLRTGLRGSPALCVVGPEGGWTGAEVQLLCRAGFHPVHLGNQIFRSETAAILAVGLVAYELGAI